MEPIAGHVSGSFLFGPLQASARQAARDDAEPPGDLGRVLGQLMDHDGRHLTRDRARYVTTLWESHTELAEILRSSRTLEEARHRVYNTLELLERSMFFVDTEFHELQRATIRACVRTMRSIIGPANEKLTGFSALEQLWRLARGTEDELSEPISCGFLLEFIFLFRGLAGRSNIYTEQEDVLGERIRHMPRRARGREAAVERTLVLDAMARAMDAYMDRYPTGLDPHVLRRRRDNRGRVLRALGGTEEDWADYRWHLKNVVKSHERLASVVSLGAGEIRAVELAVANNVPFGATPHYLSLIDDDRALGHDRAIRSQIIPPLDYVEQMLASRADRSAELDFMGERDTSPVELVTRRYPRIAILKPYNTCAQICVYCQRNWEIDECMAPQAMSSRERIDRAVQWLREHERVNEVLVTGGDPMVMPDRAIARVLDAVSALDHVYRIRIGTRTPVVLPQRWTDSLADLVASYNVPGRREIAVVTHFQHAYEVTPEAMTAVRKLRDRGLGVYNQVVFSVENSRRFECAKLRKTLRSIGIDPYYTFNMKGKDETRSYMAPIARLQQELKEESRLMPGLDRTDEPVFNVPRLGKNHLRSWQDHRLLSVRPDGCRVYAFHPWEKNIALAQPYNYVDVSIYDYLQRLADRGETIDYYRTIYYYF